MHLQTNVVQLHVPSDVDLEAAYSAIATAGYTPDSKTTVSAFGQWEVGGFRPDGWSQTLATPQTARPPGEGPWKLTFQRGEQGWSLVEAEPIESVPQVKDIDSLHLSH